MKRTIPLFITFLSGMILVVATFIPYSKNWKNEVVIWFDILAAIAFVLGGGNLLMMHLKKISDRRAGWGYSAIVLISFLGTLILGSIKFGSTPGAQTEWYGQTAAPLPLVDFPQSSTTAGSIPPIELPPIVKGQLTSNAENNVVTFVGWMTDEQRQDLKGAELDTGWHKTVDRLFELSQPPGNLKDRITYRAQLEVLTFAGVMSDEAKTQLAGAGKNEDYETAINRLFTLSNETHSIPLDALPPGYEVPKPLQDVVVFDAANKRLQITGPMSVEQQQALVQNFPPGKPMTPDEKQKLIDQLSALGPLDKSLSDTIREYNKEASTAARRNHDLFFELLRVAQLHSGVQLNDKQREFLLKDYDIEVAWALKVGDLFVAAHQVKYPYSGQYNSEGSAIWYVYEYMFQALTATMFSLLAFYVASAAFRAFRAKNIEAILLLSTAFIVLLGRTYLGTWLTSWMPASLSGLTIPELTTVIMSVFTTAGNRAIMIGIALGVVSTSLKILLGIDRSYLGSESE